MTTDATTAADTGSSRPAELFQLDASTCVALLGIHHVGRLIIPGDDPYVIPVNYSAVAGAVVLRTERRPVIDAVIDHPVVFEVDMFDDRSKSGWSVVVRGHARDVTADTDLTGDTDTGLALRSWAPGDRNCVIRISADRLTGRLLRGEITSPPDEHGYL